MNNKNTKIEIGTGVTFVCGSDLYAYYVSDILRTDNNGEATELEIVKASINGRDESGNTIVLPFENVDAYATRLVIKRTKANKYGRRFWTDNGRIGFAYYTIGSAREYRDPEF